MLCCLKRCCVAAAGAGSDGSATVLSVSRALGVHGQVCACGRRAAGELKKGGVKNKSSSRRLW